MSFVALFAAFFCAAGCINIISRNPLYDRDKDRTFDSQLVGKWNGKLEAEKNEPEELSLEIRPGGGTAYIAVIPADDHSVQDKDGHELEELPFDLVKFGSRRYIFAGSINVPSPQEPGESQHPGPIAKLKRRGDKLYIRLLSAKALLSIAQANPALLPYEWKPAAEAPATNNKPNIVEGTLILKCTREQMVEVLRKFDDQLFPDDAKLTFKRVKD